MESLARGDRSESRLLGILNGTQLRQTVDPQDGSARDRQDQASGEGSYSGGGAQPGMAARPFSRSFPNERSRAYLSGRCSA